MDNFLDEGMGATLGLWPRADSEPAGNCLRQSGGAVNEGCWDFHMERLAEANKDEEQHWSVRLWAMLREHRDGAKDAQERTRDEL